MQNRFRTLTGALLIAAAAQAAHAPQDNKKLLKLIERQTQISTLLSSGKLAFDAGDYPTAAARFSALLRIEGVPADVERAVKPLLAEASAKGGAVDADTAAALEGKAAQPAVAHAPEPPPRVEVQGGVLGGGNAGPGGAVVTFRRVDGPTPRPAPQDKPLLQRNKSFVPHVLAVPVGSEVDFKNEDEIFHNVFSLSPAAKFDTGLHKGGEVSKVKFEKPGVVELFCNIHASMLGFLVVVDTPWYAVADGSGSFTVRNVPPGTYDVEVWHESATTTSKRRVQVQEGMARLSLVVGGDKRVSQFPPDKYGKPRQAQLGY